MVRQRSAAKHHDCSQPSTALDGRLNSPPDLNAPNREFGTKRPCQTRARSCGEPRGTAGSRHGCDHTPALLGRRSVHQLPPKNPSFPS